MNLALYILRNKTISNGKFSISLEAFNDQCFGILFRYKNIHNYLMLELNEKV